MAKKTLLQKIEEDQRLRRTGQTIIKQGYPTQPTQPIARETRPLKQKPSKPTAKKKLLFRKPLKKLSLKGLRKRQKASVSRRAKGTGRFISALKGTQPQRRGISPEQQARLRRLQQLQKISGMQNTNQGAIYQKFLEDKNRSLQARLLKEKQLSPNTQHELEIIARIQNKGRMEDAQQQRRNRERRALGNAMDIMKTPNIFNHAILDFTNVDSQENILMAKNVFENDPIKNPSILKTREGARTILDTVDNIMKPKKRLKF